MQLKDVMNTEEAHAKTHMNTEATQRAQCAEKSEMDQLQETFKDVKNADSALSLLQTLRAGSQISDAAHESLLKVFQKLQNNSELPSAESEKVEEKEDGDVSARPDCDMAEEPALAAAGIKIPKRKSTARPFKHPSSKRQQLTSEEAAEIYSMRPEVAKGSSLRRGCMVKSKMIAPHFGVTPKTVRDIWHARTWVSATRHLWTEDEIAHRAKGVVESDDDESKDSSGSASPTLSTLEDAKLLSTARGMMGFAGLQGLPGIVTGVPSLPMQLPSLSANPMANVSLHNFAGLGPAGMHNYFAPNLLNGFSGTNALNFPNCQPSLGPFPSLLPSVNALKMQ